MKYLGNLNIEGSLLVKGTLSAQTIQNSYIDGYIDITELKWEKENDYEYVVNVNGVSSGDFVFLRVSDSINSFLNICKNK